MACMHCELAHLTPACDAVPPDAVPANPRICMWPLTCIDHELTHFIPAHAAAATWSDAGSRRAAVDASRLAQALNQKLSSRSPTGTANMHAGTATVMHSGLDTTRI